MRSGKYDSIINRPHHTSKRRPRMPLIDRAAQFSPFAALTGYDTAVRETARLAEEQVEKENAPVPLEDYQIDE